MPETELNFRLDTYLLTKTLCGLFTQNDAASRFVHVLLANDLFWSQSVILYIYYTLLYYPLLFLYVALLCKQRGAICMAIDRYNATWTGEMLSFLEY